MEDVENMKWGVVGTFERKSVDLLMECVQFEVRSCWGGACTVGSEELLMERVL